MIKAAKYAKLKVLQILNEPTAAGISYLVQRDAEIERDSYSLIFDFGGGTLDVSLLHNSKEQITVVGTDGDMFLGGRDFDENTIDYLIKKLGINNMKKKKLAKFHKSVIGAKKMLSVYPECEINYVCDHEEKKYTLTLKEFEEINKDHINRITVPIKIFFKKLHSQKVTLIQLLWSVVHRTCNL